MGLFKSSTPAAPDPYKVASADAQFNRLDTYSPAGGGTRYGYTDANGNFVQGTAPQGMQSAVQQVESPWEKSIRETLQPASLGLINNVLTQNGSGIPGPAQVQSRDDVAKAIFDRNMSMMQPQIDQTNSRLLTNLQARGLPVGSAAFNSAYGDQQRQTQDTISRLAQDATTSAGAEQSRQFALDSSQRQNAMSEIMAALGGGYNPPSATPSGAAPTVNYSGAVQAGTQAQAAQAQQRASNASALGSAASAMLMKCTETAKAVGGAVDGAMAANAVSQLPIYVWRYLPGQAPDGMGEEEHIGPMAEDFHAITGLGDARTISVIDAVGLLLAGLRHAMERIVLLEVELEGRTVH